MMKHFSIPKPCSENWQEMTPTEKGAFCQKCSHEVHDVTGKSNPEILNLFAQNRGKRTCVRMTISQEKSLDREYALLASSKKKHMQRAMLFSLLVVFGFTLFSCNSPEQVKELESLQTAVKTVERSQEIDSVEETKEIEVINKESIQESQKDYPPNVSEEVEEIIMLGEAELVEQEMTDEVTFPFDKDYITMGVPMQSFEFPELEPIEQVEIFSEFEVRVEGVPTTFDALAFPNPATTETRLEVKLPEYTENLQIRLLDMTGKVLEVINELPADAGVHNFNVSVSHLKPAYYLLDVRYNGEHKVVRLSKV